MTESGEEPFLAFSSDGNISLYLQMPVSETHLICYTKDSSVCEI